MSKRQRKNRASVVAEEPKLTTAWWRTPAAAMICLVIVCAAVFHFVTQLGWLTWDDRQNVLANPYVNPPSWEGLRHIWAEPYFGQYIPVAYSYWAGEAAVAGWLPETSDGQLSATVFHVGNLLLHMACACLVFLLLRRLVGNTWAACAGALLFALHPLQVEAVCWISEARGTLSAAWMLVALLAHVRLGDEYTSAGRGARDGRRWRLVCWYVAGLVAFGLALLSKPSAVALPAVALVLDLAWLRRSWQFSLASLLPWLLPAAAVIWITTDVQSGARVVAEAVPIVWRPLLALDAVWFYLNKLIIPWSFSPDYGRTPQHVIESNLIYFTPWIPLLLVALLWYSSSQRWWIAPIGIFVAALLPVLGLIPFTHQQMSTVADRYAYFALLGPALALAFWLSRGSSYRCVIAAFGLLALGGISNLHSRLWLYDGQLFRHALEVNPRSYVATEKLGGVHHARQEYDEAEQYYRRAIELNPNYHVAHNNLGNLLQLLGQFDEAAAEYQAALEVEPGLTTTRFNLANIHLQAGRTGEAIDGFREILAAEPGFTLARVNLGVALLQQGHDEEALAELQTAVRMEPQSSNAHRTLGVTLARLGDLREAEKHLNEALHIDPNDELAKETLGQVRQISQP